MNLLKVFYFLGCYTCLTGAFGIYRFGNIYKVLFDEIPTRSLFNASKTITARIKQQLDHFNVKENRTWCMRYFANLDYWKIGGPIYLFIYGEGEAADTFYRVAILQDLAKETNGAMYATEHRYYGKSRPFKKVNTRNLAYLSSRQALADIANFLKHIKVLPQFHTSKVVVIGGSYAGNLAAWMKVLYPKLVDAAIASSAPVLAKKDYYEYLETVSDDFKQYGTSGCHNKIKEIFERYQKLFQSKDGIKVLKKEENICRSTNMSKPENKQLFFLDKVSPYMGAAQYGNPEMIKNTCKKVMNKTTITPMKTEYDLRIAEENNCTNYDFDYMIESSWRVDWLVAWTYQTCTEFGYFMSSSSKNHPFTDNIPVDLYYRICSKMYGVDYDEARVDRGIKLTNDMYGGLKPNVSNVVFVNGELDPWARLGILEDLSNNAPATVIPRASHCSDLSTKDLNVTEEVTKTSKHVKHLIKKWIGMD